MRLVTAAAAALLVLSLASCGSDDDSEQDSSQDGDATPSAAASDPSESTSDAGDDSATAQASPPGPCELVSTEDVAAAYGVPFEEGSEGFGGHNENDVEYSSVDCDWEAEDQMEVELSLSFAEDFEQGFVCQPVRYLGDEGSPVEVPGSSSATWLASEDPNEIEARLRACTDTAVITIEVDAENGSSVAALRSASVAVAEQALAGL